MRYRLAALGGTFDRLHRGHRDFLQFSLSKSDYVVLGLTSDAYIKKNKDGLGIESYEIRKKNLQIFLQSIQKKSRVKIVQIDDLFGPTILPEYKFDVIIVTQDTVKGGEEINKKRREVGLLDLPLEVFSLTKEVYGVPIASSTIRKVIFALPANLRFLLQEPWGKVTEKVPRNIESEKTITVGDVTTKMFLDQGIHPKLAIIDLYIEREHSVKKIEELGFSSNQPVTHVKNPAATITPELVVAIREALTSKQHTLIIVEGEEDLAVLPALLEADNGCSVFYGQPGQGMVEVEVNDKIKKRAQDLLAKFDKK
ncbi:MAG: pantetheine-phosphate adenylyltransferase [Candidatus Levybacteria bacterium]|nr:pantetheine-phosphate adenylyltransferase [Candidatus Levybacteria bacterium]MBP9814923.1 pantetheine-phosphate adenylyltransferase [Candidatus Levybacteria bacterium]